MRLAPLAFAALAVFGAAPASAQTLDALVAAEQQVAAAWDALPLTFRKTLFATGIEAYGVYTPKDGSTFAPGEQIVVYAEPVGYGYRTNADGTFGFGFNFDLVVKTKDGEIVAGKDQFATFELTSNAQNREFLVSLTLTLNEAPAGDYVLEYLAHDIASDETATISMPFTISE
ncbi:MAG TPA: hypothetical protein VIN06_18590 [Devosia sp.]